MFNLSLIACSFHLKTLHKRKKEYIFHLDDSIEYIDENGDTALLGIKEAFIKFFRTYAGAINDDDKQKTFSCEFEDEYNGETDNFHYIYAIIRSGSYGSASDIRDIVTQKISYRKKATEADERPFYAYVVIPKSNKDVNVQKGMLIFQNIGPYGIKSLATDLMSKFFSNNFKIAFKCSTVSADLFIKKVLVKDKIQRLIMVKNHKSDDLTDRTILGYGEETRIISSFSFSSNIWETLMDKIQYCAKGRYNLFEFENKKYDNLKINVKIGDRDRVIDLHNIENLSIIEGIPDDIKMADGLPNESRLLEHFMKVAEEYLSEMVLQIK